MEIDFGYIETYVIERGFGYITQSLESIERGRERKTWFHITKIKHNYPELAKQLDTGLGLDVPLWFEIDSSDRKKVGTVWLDPKDMPEPQHRCLLDRIEQQWSNLNPDDDIPKWLESATSYLVEKSRVCELKQLYEERVHRLNIQREKRKARRKLLLQRRSQKQHFPSPIERVRAERGIIETIFATDNLHGLPPELKAIVRPCPRIVRTNPLSHKPGGSDVIVAYSLGDAILYDWIKNVVAYVSSFQRSDPRFHAHIQSIYGRFCRHESERNIGVFCQIWDYKKDGRSKLAIKACVERYQRRMEIGNKTLHEEAKKYWASYGLSDKEIEELPTLYERHLKEKEDCIDVDDMI